MLPIFRNCDKDARPGWMALAGKHYEVGERTEKNRKKF
jgi:hypothetical protein